MVGSRFGVGGGQAAHVMPILKRRLPYTSTGHLIIHVSQGIELTLSVDESCPGKVVDMEPPSKRKSHGKVLTPFF